MEETIKGVVATLPPVKVLFQKSWARMRERWGLMVLAELVMWGGMILGVIIFAIIAGVSMVSSGLTAGTQGELPTPFLSVGFWIAAVLVGIFFFAVSIWQMGATTYAVIHDTKPTFRQMWQAGWKYFWAILWLQAIVTIIVWGATFLLVIPGIFLGLASMFTLYVHVHDGTRGMSAILRSKQLVSGHWWRIFARVLLASLAVMIPYFVLIGIGGLFNEGGMSLVALGYEFLFMIPFFMAFTAELYGELVHLKPVAGPWQLKKLRWKFAALTVGGFILTLLVLVPALMAMLSAPLELLE